MTTESQTSAAAHEATVGAVPQAAAAAEDNTVAVEGSGVNGADDVTSLEGDVANLALGQSPQAQSELHGACAEGRVDDVRAILAHGLDQLETLDVATGCTPIVLAVSHGHADVVRELLAAGAIVPPPGLTMDPAMLALLYPQQMYGVPPPFAQMPPQFYQPGFFPGGPAPFAPRKDSAPHGNGTNGAPSNANLPPAEVAKTIPCRNFPNCKYGGSCMFFHPAQVPGGFFPGAPGYAHYEGGFMPYPPNGAPFYPVGQEFVPAANGEQQDGSLPEGTEAANGTQQESSDSTPQLPSAHTPAFVPGNGVANGDAFIGSPPLGYMSPPMMATNGPPMPSDPAFFATSPPQFQPFIPNGNFPGGPGRRQSFGQFNGGPKFGHGKKPSFSGGPKPWGPGGRAGASHLGQWKDGNPPPCAFFREGKCRNGEFCKFPHIDAEGTDVRHPDVIRGIIPPAPTRPRVMRMMQGGHYDPARQHQILQAKAAQSAAAANGEASPEGEVGSPVTSSDKETELSASATLPPKPSGSVPPSRSASQPGVSRAHANSPPNGPRRGGPRTFANGHAARSSSNGAADAKKSLPPQRIPRADEFPALGIKAGSPSSERREASWGSKTAAQVLSEPAPAKPVKEEDETTTTDDKAAEAAKSSVVTMDSDSEQDAVIISVSTTPNPEVAKAKLAPAPAAAPTTSFASVAGTVEAAPVALKA